MVRALLPYGTHIYGNDTWKSVLDQKSGDLFRGQAHRADLPDIYASADINLNCHSPQLPYGLNVRDFNVLRAGGCLVSDYVPAMDGGIFVPDKDLAIYRDINGMLEVIEDLLLTPPSRE